MTAAWIAAGAAGWVVVAVLVSLLLGRVIALRDRDDDRADP